MNIALLFLFNTVFASDGLKIPFLKNEIEKPKELHMQIESPQLISPQNFSNQIKIDCANYAAQVRRLLNLSSPEIKSNMAELRVLPLAVGLKPSYEVNLHINNQSSLEPIFFELHKIEKMHSSYSENSFSMLAEKNNLSVGDFEFNEFTLKIKSRDLMCDLLNGNFNFTIQGATSWALKVNTDLQVEVVQLVEKILQLPQSNLLAAARLGLALHEVFAKYKKLAPLEFLNIKYTFNSLFEGESLNVRPEWQTKTWTQTTTHIFNLKLDVL